MPQLKHGYQIMVRVKWENGKLTDALEGAYADDGPNKSTVYSWRTHTKNKWDDFEDEAHSSRPSTSICKENINCIHTIIEKNKGMMINNIKKKPAWMTSWFSLCNSDRKIKIERTFCLLCAKTVSPISDTDKNRYCGNLSNTELRFKALPPKTILIRVETWLSNILKTKYN